MTGKDIAKMMEGCHKKVGTMIHPYICPANYPTIGWGRLLKSLDHPPITQEQADAMFEVDWSKHQKQALAASPTLANDDVRLGAITSFVYNLGAGNYQASTLRRAVNAGDWQEARYQIRRWNKGGGKVLPGLVKRRALEAALL
ncbi:lysozyme [Aquidulcibacter sp.]|uniref:lysozyme n=1 Tax=Aquidulcibacter sp. TaxID=2052990 RepID=UPI0025BBE2CD|nr:lysozyme [Aquidulcibacter sp.]